MTAPTIDRPTINLDALSESQREALRFIKKADQGLVEVHTGALGSPGVAPRLSNSLRKLGLAERVKDEDKVYVQLTVLGQRAVEEMGPPTITG